MLKIIFSFLFFMLLIWGIIQGMKLGFTIHGFLRKVVDVLILVILTTFLLVSIVLLF